MTGGCSTDPTSAAGGPAFGRMTGVGLGGCQVMRLTTLTHIPLSLLGGVILVYEDQVLDLFGQSEGVNWIRVHGLGPRPGR